MQQQVKDRVRLLMATRDAAHVRGNMTHANLPRICEIAAAWRIVAPIVERSVERRAWAAAVYIAIRWPWN